MYLPGSTVVCSIVLAVLGSHRAHFGCAVCTSTGWDRTFLCILVFLYLIKQRARTQQGKHALIPLQQHSAAPRPCGVFDSSGFALRYSLTARASWALAKQSQNMWRKHSSIQQLPGNGSFDCERGQGRGRGKIQMVSTFQVGRQGH